MSQQDNVIAPNENARSRNAPLLNGMNSFPCHFFLRLCARVVCYAPGKFAPIMVQDADHIHGCEMPFDTNDARSKKACLALQNCLLRSTIHHHAASDRKSTRQSHHDLVCRLLLEK